MARARELAAQLMENSPSSVRATKRLINGFIAATARSADRRGGRGQRAHPHHRGFPRRHHVVSGKAQTALERRSEPASKRARTATAWSRESRVRVRYAETDQMGVVYHANHFIWFEIGRVELMRQLGFSYRDMERDDGCFIAVVDARCRYKAPARYDDEIIVRTHLKNVRESVIHFGYELVRADDGELLAEGETTHIVTRREDEDAPLPEKYLKAFREAAGK